MECRVGRRGGNDKISAQAVTTIAEARRRPAALHAATAPAPPASLLPRGGRHARTLATAMATMTKTKSKGRCRDDDFQGQEEAGCVVRSYCPCPARLAIATGRTAHKDIGGGNNKNEEHKVQSPVPR